MASRLFARRIATVNGKGIEVGSIVMYSRDFLRSTGQYTGTAPFAKGTVTKLVPFGSSGNIAVIDWGKDEGELPEKVLTTNLILASNRHLELASKKKATVLVSKQSLEQAIQMGNVLVEQLIDSAPNDERLDQLEEAISFLESVLHKAPTDMQQEGASTLDDYMDDAVMPDTAGKIKQDVDMIAKMINDIDEPQSDRMGNLPTDSTVEMNNRANEWDEQTLKDRPVQASGSDNWVNDREDDGKPKTPEVAEVPRVAAVEKKCPVCGEAQKLTPTGTIWPHKSPKGIGRCPGSEELPGKKAAGITPVQPPALAPTAPVTPSPTPEADIAQLSSDTLSKVLKALSTAEDLKNDKAATAFIGAITDELAERPVEPEEAPAQELPKAAAWLGGLNLAAAEKTATGQAGGSWFATDEDTGTLVEDGGRTPEINEAHGKLEDHTGIKRPATELPSKFAASHEKLLHVVRQFIEIMNEYGNLNVSNNSPIMNKLRDAVSDFDEEDKWDWPETGAGLENSEHKASNKLAEWEDGYWKGPKKDGYPASYFDEDDTFQYPWEKNQEPRKPVAGTEKDKKTAAFAAYMKFASGDMTSGKAVKMVERLGNDLKSLYLEAKPVTQVLDSRPVREAIESVYRAYDMMGEAAKALNKLNMQEESEAKALEIKSKGKKGSFTVGKCRYCGKPTEYNFCSEKCRKANNEEMSKDDYASPEEMQRAKKNKASSLMFGLNIASSDIG